LGSVPTDGGVASPLTTVPSGKRARTLCSPQDKG
jgi:hypothetical protein